MYMVLQYCLYVACNTACMLLVIQHVCCWFCCMHVACCTVWCMYISCFAACMLLVLLYACCLSVCIFCNLLRCMLHVCCCLCCVRVDHSVALHQVLSQMQKAHTHSIGDSVIHLSQGDCFKGCQLESAVSVSLMNNRAWVCDIMVESKQHLRKLV